MRKTAKITWTGLVVIESAMWGIGNSVVKLALKTLTPFWLRTLQFGIAFVLLAVIFGRRTITSLNRRNLPWILLSGLMNAAAYILATFCLAYATATSGGFLMSLPVVFTPFLAFVFFRQKPNWPFYPIVGIIVVGTYLMCGGGGSFAFGAGELFGVISSLSFAAALIVTGKLADKISAPVMTTVQVGVMAVCSFALATIFEDWQIITAAGTGGWVAVLYLAIVCTFMAYLLQNIALRHVSPVAVSLAFSSEPVFTAVAAFIILGERLDAGGVTGAALLLVGIVLASAVKSAYKPDK